MNNFNECYEYSLGAREMFDENVLLKIIPSADHVEKTGTDADKSGIDYIVYLKDGSMVTVDAKTRKPGSRKWWKHGEPELCLERYSVKEIKKWGWLFKNSTEHPDYILYTFNKEDCDKVYVVPFMLLRKAAKNNWRDWIKRHGIKDQPNETHRGYTSDAVFVPASELIAAISSEMTQMV